MTSLLCRSTAFALTFLVATAVFSQEALVQGSNWDERTAKIEGDWKIVERDGGLVLVLGANFKTKKAPDLKAFLAPLPSTAVDKRKIPAGSLRLGLLKSHTGAQEIQLPAGTSLDGYRTLMIHCEKYGKVWGVSSLRSKR
jgi:hypothetical protein